MHTNRDKYPKRLNTPELISEEPHIDPMHANCNGANVGGATSNTSVLELNGKHGYVSLTSSDKTITITPSTTDNTINLQAGTDVRSLNSITGVVLLKAGANISIANSGQSIAISAKIAENVSTLLVSATHTDTLTGTVVKGDMITGNATPKWSRLAGGTAGQALVMTNSIPAWGTLSLAKTTGTLGVTQGGTSKATIAKGSLLYASAADTIISLPIGAEGKELTVVAGVPAWGSHIESYYVTTGDVVATNLSVGTATSIPALSFTYVSAGKYLLDGCLLIKTSVAACGFKFKLDTSSAVTTVTIMFEHPLANTGTLTAGYGYADNTVVGLSSGLPSANTVVPCHVHGLLIATANAAGGCKVKFCGELNAGKVTVMSGSILRVVKVA